MKKQEYVICPFCKKNNKLKKSKSCRECYGGKKTKQNGKDN